MASKFCVSDMSILGFSIVGISKMISIFILGYPQPPREPPGGAWGGPKGVYHQKSSDMSILGFSIVGISKVISIFILGYPQPPQGRPPRRGGLGGQRGYTPKNQVLCHFWNTHYWKPESWHNTWFLGIYPLCPPPSPPGGRPCGGWGEPKMKIDIIFEIPTIENPKIDTTHDFWWFTPSGPPTPSPRGRPCGGWG